HACRLERHGRDEAERQSEGRFPGRVEEENPVEPAPCTDHGPEHERQRQGDGEPDGHGVQPPAEQRAEERHRKHATPDQREGPHLRRGPADDRQPCPPPRTLPTAWNSTAVKRTSWAAIHGKATPSASSAAHSRGTTESVGSCTCVAAISTPIVTPATRLA